MSLLLEPRDWLGPIAIYLGNLIAVVVRVRVPLPYTVKVPFACGVSALGLLLLLLLLLPFSAGFHTRSFSATIKHHEWIVVLE